MNAKTKSSRKQEAFFRGGTFLRISAAAALAAALALTLAACQKAARTVDIKCKVVRSDVIVTVLQAGELQAKNSNPIINETEASCKIIEIVEEGVMVKKGDVLVQLESAELDDRVLAAENDVTNASAVLDQAKETKKIDTLKYNTDHDTAKLSVELSKLEIRKYEEAQYPQDILKNKGQILIALGDLSDTSSTLESTRELVAKGFANRQDLVTEQLKAQRMNINLINMKEDLRILQEYTHEKDLKELNNFLAQAEGNLEQLEKTREAQITATSVTIQSKAMALKLSESQRERLKTRLEKSTILSEYDGLVFYPKMDRHSSRSNIEKGASVFPRQKLLEFPDLSAWIIKVGVPESIIKKVQIGQKAAVMIDALPGEIIEAVVDRISMAPDRGSFWDSDSKAYAVYLDVPDPGELDLKPGMSVMVEIVIKELKDVLNIPLQAVRADGNRHYVYLVEGDTVTPTSVEVGDHSEELIAIASGLKEGQEVLLYAPMKAESDAGLKESPLEKQGRNGSGERGGRGGREASAGPAGAGGPGGEQPGVGGGQRGPGGGGRREGQGPGANMSEEERQKMRERFQNMTPEQRDALRKSSPGGQGGPR